MKHKTKPKRRAVRRKPLKPMLPAEARPEMENLPAVVSRADFIPTATAAERALVVGKNFYEIAAGMSRTTIPQLALMAKLPTDTALRWIMLCPTPKNLVWYRPGAGAKTTCPDKVTCRTCPEDTFKACTIRLAYVPGWAMKAFLNMLFPGRWSLDGMTVEHIGDDYVARGYLVLTHTSGHVQRIYQCGDCQCRSGMTPGHASQGAVTQLIKKALSEIGFCADVYSGRTMQEDIPPETGDKPAPPTKAEEADTEKRRNQLTKLFREIDARLKSDPRSVHKSGYTPRMAWDDADHQWPDSFAAEHPEFKTTTEAVDCYAGLPHDEFVAIYSRINNKWRKSDRALTDAKYGKTETAPDPSGTRKPKMGDVATPKFKLWAQRVLGARSWRDAEPEVNRVVKLYAERAKRADLADWLDLTPVDAQNLRALLQEEATKGGKS